MPAFDWRPRKSLAELRPRHLHMVEEYGIAETYDRDELGDYFLAHWYRLFGPLRKSKIREVASDWLRKELMVSRLLDLIEMRRAEYAEIILIQRCADVPLRLMARRLSYRETN